MKKIVMTTFLLLFVGVSLHAQDKFFTDSLRRELMQVLIDKNIASDPELFRSLFIRNLISMENLKENPKAGKDPYGIYDFHDEGQFYIFSLVLVRNGDNYEIMDIFNKSRSEIKVDLKNYFNRHPDVPKTLYSTYSKALNRVRKEHSRLEKVWDIRIEKDPSNDSAYRYVDRSSGGVIVFETFID